MLKKDFIEKIIHSIFFLLGLFSIAIVLIITIYLIISGFPAIYKIGIDKFLLGKTWASTSKTPFFGILPFILTSIYGTTIAIIIAVPIGIFSAIWVSKEASPLIRNIFENTISLLAGIPSVVYGLVGMLVIVPNIRNIFNIPDGAGLFSAIIVLIVMILPSIIKVCITSLDNVPKEYEFASFSLGATKSETWTKISIPAAKSGISAAIILGVGRAVGEAMAVMMVAGNVANMPSLFQSVRFLTTAISSEMGYSSGLQRQALFSIALILFIFILFINTLLNLITKRGK